MQIFGNFYYCSFYILFSVFIAADVFAQTTYFSRGTGGDWSKSSSWTFSTDGSGPSAGSVPSRNDEVIILYGSTITIDRQNANGSNGVSPRDLGYSGFTGSNSKAFYHTGNISVRAGGTLESTNQPFLNAGNFVINEMGRSILDKDFINIGQFQAMERSRVELGDDLILTGNSQTIINNITTINDDIYLDRQNAILCGTGSITIGNLMQTFNAADPNKQICDSFTIECGGNCGLGTGSSFTGSGEAPLPIELLYFSGTSEHGKVNLDWTTAWEENFDFFTIERAGTDMVFKAIGEVKGKGNSTAEVAYSFADQFPLQGQAFYRLKATDFDGTLEYHRIISVYSESLASASLQVYPNPVRDQQISISTQGFTPEELKIMDLSGKVVFSKRVTADMQQISLPTQIRAGAYLLIITSPQGNRLQQKIMVL